MVSSRDASEHASKKVQEKGTAALFNATAPWNFGPVVPRAYHEYKQFGCGNIPPIKSYIQINTKNVWDSKRIPYDDSVIEKKDKKQINKVVDLFSGYSATDLVALTHQQSPWINSYEPYAKEVIPA